MITISFLTGYAGQIIDPEVFHEKPVFGSELALLEVAQRLGKKANVSIFISKPAGYVFKKWDITWRSDADWNELVIQNPPMHIVISRYIGCMNDLRMPPSSKIWLWVHDVTPHCAYNGKMLEPSYTNNMCRRLSGVITVGDSQRDEIIIPQYKIPRHLFTTIKNGINLVPIPNKKRCPMSFVYASGVNRGLDNLLRMWPGIQKEWPHATLQIFHSLTDEEKQKIVSLGFERISPVGKVNQKTLFQKLELIDYWLYPCSFFETCCTTAIEMAYHGPICISNDLGALKENNKGIIVPGEKFGEDVMKLLHRLENNPEEKEEIRKRQYLWAKEQTWDNRAEEWCRLFSV